MKRQTSLREAFIKIQFWNGQTDRQTERKVHLLLVELRFAAKNLEYSLNTQSSLNTHGFLCRMLKPSKKKDQKSWKFSTLGGGGKLLFFQLFKDLFKIRFRPFWVILNTLFLVTFGGGTPNSAIFLSVFDLQGGKNIFFLQKCPKCGLVSEKTRKKVFNFSGNRGGWGGGLVRPFFICDCGPHLSLLKSM